MFPVVFGLLMLLGAFFVSTCITVLTFTMVDVRRTIVTVVNRLEVLGDRNYDVMVKTMEMAAENQRMLAAIQRRLRSSDVDEPGN